VAEREDGPDPVDEDAAWAEIVAGFDAEPEPGTGSWPAAEDIDADADPGVRDEEPEEEDGDGDAEDTAEEPPAAATRSIVIHPVIAGPRDFEIEEEDEGHFEPPEPPPLPQADATTKFAWLAVLGGPALIFVYILLQEEMPWWAITVGIGGFLGGFATLVARMKGDDEDLDDPGRGAVV
jgi:hypothetical protein